MSGILDSYQDSTDQALEVMAARPLEAETPKPKHSGWTTIPRAVAAGAAEVGANLADIAGAYGQTAAMAGSGSPFMPPDPQEQKQVREAYDKLTTEGIDWRNPKAKPAYEFSRDLRPDPLTAGTAENIVFGLTKGLTKAVGSATLFGLAGGATVFGTSEGMTTADDLAVRGVDKSTRTKVGLVTGAVSAASIALPVAGQTLKQTVGLVAVGGPLSFMGQQQATRSILENADYADLAAQYDPLDPVGLAVSTLLPAGFAAYAKRGGFSPKPVDVPPATPDAPPVSPDAPPPDAPTGQARPTPDQIDAVMVHNLTAAGDAREVIDPAFIKAIDEAVPPEVAPEPAPAPAPIEAAPPIDAPAKADAPQDQAAPTEAVKTEAPDIPVEVTEDGAHISAAKKLEDARRLAQEGTDTELGALDAPLLKVAAECFLSL